MKQFNLADTSQNHLLKGPNFTAQDEKEKKRIQRKSLHLHLIYCRYSLKGPRSQRYTFRMWISANKVNIVPTPCPDSEKLNASDKITLKSDGTHGARRVKVQGFQKNSSSNISCKARTVENSSIQQLLRSVHLRLSSPSPNSSSPRPLCLRHQSLPRRSSSSSWQLWCCAPTRYLQSCGLLNEQEPSMVQQENLHWTFSAC